MAALWIIGIVCVIVFIGSFIQACNKQKQPQGAPLDRGKQQNSLTGGRDSTIVHIDEFFQYHTISIPANILDKMDDAIMRGEEYMEIPDYILRKIEETTAKRKVEERRLQTCCLTNNNGIALEKAGDIDAAIAEYEENIKGGYRALHSYNRLMVLYRKRKDYDNEIRVIDYSIGVFIGDNRYDGEIAKWRERRTKAEQLKNKL